MVPILTNRKSALTSSYTAHNHVMENPCATSVPASLPAKECDADRDVRRKSLQIDRKFHVHASLLFAKPQSHCQHERYPRSIKLSDANGDTSLWRRGDS